MTNTQSPTATHPRVRLGAEPVKRPTVGRKYFVTVDGVPVTRPETSTPSALSYHGRNGGYHELNWPNQRYVHVDADVRFFSHRDEA